MKISFNITNLEPALEAGILELSNWLKEKMTEANTLQSIPFQKYIYPLFKR
jgi:hypothetical protein